MPDCSICYRRRLLPLPAHCQHRVAHETDTRSERLIARRVRFMCATLYQHQRSLRTAAAAAVCILAAISLCPAPVSPPTPSSLFPLPSRALSSAADRCIMMSDSKGFTLGVLRESLLKCKSDSGSTRSRIKRMTSEIDEVTNRIVDQNNANTQLKSEIVSMKKRRDDLNEDILKTNRYLDNLTKTNCDFIKEKVVNPAEDGIVVARESIECFREIIDSSYKLNMLFKREHPEKTDAGTQVNWSFPNKKPAEEADRALLVEVMKLQKELYKKQDVLRDARSIARGNKTNKGNFINISKSDWDEKVNMVERLKQEEADLVKELDLLENPDKRVPDLQINPDGSISVPVQMDTDEAGGDGPAVVVVQQDGDWAAPPPPQAVPVSDDDMSGSFHQAPAFEHFDN